MVWFVGGTNAGRDVAVRASPSFTKCVLELGGNSAGVIFGDVASSSPVVRAFIRSRFANSGQVCSAIKRLYVHSSKFDEVRECAIGIVDSLSIGHPGARKTELGPLSNRRDYEMAKLVVDDAVAEGAAKYVNSTGIDEHPNIYPPTLLWELSNCSAVVQEEIFAPVLPMIVFSDEDDVIQMVNDSRYGLSAFVATDSMDRARRFAARAEVGRIYVNTLPRGGVRYSFEAYKSSGLGRHQGESLIREFARMKYIEWGGSLPPSCNVAL
jgi:acyl-CoA reductase-like NAD-dependent aldehyde dehydrogenase